MKISRLYSHLNGWEHIKVHKPALWTDVEEVVARLDPDSCLTKVSREKTMPGQLLYSPKAMNDYFKRELSARGWQESRTSYWVTGDQRVIRQTMSLPPDEQKRIIEAAGERALFSYNQTDFVKDRIAIEVQFGKYSFVAYDLFVKHMAFFVGDVIDVGVEILPMKELQEKMSSGVAYYEGELYNLIRQGRGVPAVPLVMVGIAP
ncbi:MAG TPA: restriction endonuclease [Firmicutes bacterium]|nr:restriction endonuclease [Bacillota bacterium]